jgi:hypothetical protein
MRPQADRILVAQLTGEAWHCARWCELTAEEESAAVAALAGLAGGRGDLLAEVAGEIHLRQAALPGGTGVPGYQIREPLTDSRRAPIAPPQITVNIFGVPTPSRLQSSARRYPERPGAPSQKGNDRITSRYEARRSRWGTDRSRRNGELHLPADRRGVRPAPLPATRAGRRPGRTTRQ